MFTVYYRTNAAIQNNPVLFSAPDVVDHRDYVKVAELDVENMGSVYRQMNVVDGNELPVQLKVRSMMPGDVVVNADGDAWMCAAVGWEKTAWRWGRRPE